MIDSLGVFLLGAWGLILILISFLFFIINSNFDNAVSRIRQWASDRSGTPASSTLSPSSSTTHLAGMAIAMSAISAPNALNDSMLSGGKVNLTSSQRKRIKHYMKRCQMNPRNSQLNLESYLLLPVQRIPRYRLLVSDSFLFEFTLIWSDR